MMNDLGQAWRARQTHVPGREAWGSGAGGTYRPWFRPSCCPELPHSGGLGMIGIEALTHKVRLALNTLARNWSPRDEGAHRVVGGGLEECDKSSEGDVVLLFLLPHLAIISGSFNGLHCLEHTLPPPAGVRNCPTRLLQLLLPRLILLLLMMMMWSEARERKQWQHEIAKSARLFVGTEQKFPAQIALMFHIELLEGKRRHHGGHGVLSVISSLLRSWKKAWSR